MRSPSVSNVFEETGISAIPIPIFASNRSCTMLSLVQMIFGSKPRRRQFVVKMDCQRSGMMISCPSSSRSVTLSGAAPISFSLVMMSTSGSFGSTIDS